MQQPCYSMLLAVFINWLASQIRHSQLAETAVSRFYQMASQPIMLWLSQQKHIC